MTPTISTIDWQTIPNWLTARLTGFDVPGLFRFLHTHDPKFLGRASTHKTGLGPRIRAYRSGGARSHYAGEQIYRHRHELELQIAVLDMPSHEIVLLHEALLAERHPIWNVPPEYFPER